MSYRQQGDCLFHEAKFSIVGKKIVKSGLIKLGSASGHAHVLKNGKLYLDKENKMYIVADKKTQVVHDEHKPIDLPKGKYFIDTVKEYDHFLEESKQVVD